MDDGILGFGESEGHVVAGDVDQTSPGSLERQVLGDGVDTVASELDAAQAGEESSPGRGKTNC
jgi:hypothetical protein